MKLVVVVPGFDIEGIKLEHAILNDQFCPQPLFKPLAFVYQWENCSYIKGGYL